MKEKTIEEAYSITCPYCGYEQKCHKSLGHHSGMYRMGGGSCLKCKQYFNIEYLPNTNTMKTKTWEEYIKTTDV